MRRQTGEVVAMIRKNKGFSQKYVSSHAISQGAYSKFEKLNTHIRQSAFEHILLKLEMSYDEFKYIQNGYEYSYQPLMLNRLFNLTYNDKIELKKLLDEVTEYLKQNDDSILKDLSNICKSLIILGDTNNIEEARIPLQSVWERLSKRNLLYITDIYFFNTILFLFPVETALEIRKFAFRSIDRYKTFDEMERLKINIFINISLLLIKDKRFEEGLIETEQAIILCKKYSDYLRLAICYVRKGICLNHLGNSEGIVWTEKGKYILTAIEEFDILKVIDDEINRHNITK